MKKKNSTNLETCLNEVLQEKSFKRIGKNWYLEERETVLMVDLQKSDLGDQFYVNLGREEKGTGTFIIA